MSKNFAFPSVTNVNPARREKTRKEIFIDKLKGKRACRVTPNAPDGLVFSLCNEVTAEIQTICKMSGTWIVWGTTSYPPMTDIELEEYLTEQLDIVFQNGDDSKVLRLMDENGILEWY